MCIRDRSAAGPVVLEILDRAGKRVRRFSSADPTPRPDSGLNIPTWWIRPPERLGTAAGAHRFVWDLHYPPPAALRHDYPIAAVPRNTPREPRGPWVVPGRYTVHLTVDGHVFATGLEVRMDPRVVLAAGTLERQFALASRVVDALRRDSVALDNVRALRGELGRARERAGAGPLAPALDSLDQHAAALESAAPQRGTTAPETSLARLNAHRAALYAGLEGADAAPTTQAEAAVRDCEGVLATLDRQAHALWGRFRSVARGLQ